jgi:ABC-type Zn uptake system ZnuABC Zn-binding protein ZnuA
MIAHNRPRAAFSPAFPVLAVLPLLLLLSGCGAKQTTAGPARGAPVVAVETFLADFSRQVAGDRMEVRSIVPAGVDPHEYEPTPRDVAMVAGARLIVENGAGLESFMAKLLASVGGNHPVVEASDGLAGRSGREGEVLEGGGIASGPSKEKDPHFWLDPVMAETYVLNIRDAFIRVDPPGAEVYRTNADAYITKLKELDAWIAEHVAQIPPAERKLVTNHESFGYFADRYGFQIIGTVIPSVSADASPTARQLARLVDGLKAAHARALFLETGSSPQLAAQVATEAGIAVVTALYTHSLSDAGGPAPSYLEMMRYDVTTIVAALSGGGK